MSYDKEMIERDELVERVANILENMPECHGLSSVKILALTRAAVAECEKELATLRSAFADERALRVEQIEMRQSIEAQAAEMRTALTALLTQSDGTLIGAGYQRGGGNVVMVLEVSVNHVLDARDALSTDAGQKEQAEK